MLKKVYLFAFIFVMGLFLAACGSSDSGGDSSGAGEAQENEGTSDDAEKITLTFADYQPETHFSVQNLQQPLADLIEELTDGQVEVDYYPGEQLGKAGDMLNLVQTGAADMAYVSQAYVSGNMQLSSIASLPGFQETQHQASRAIFELISSDPVLEEDYLKNGVRPIAASTSTSYEFWTTDKPIKSVEDLKGMKIRTSGGAANLHIEALGGVPTSISAPEQYEALERNTIDGTLFTITSVPSYNLQEVVNYATLGAGGGPNLAIIFINEDVWSSLPSDIQDKILQAGEQATEHYLDMAHQQALDIQTENTENGNIEFIEVDSDEFAEASADVVDQWVEENEAKGLPAQEAVDLYRELLDKYRE